MSVDGDSDKMWTVRILGVCPWSMTLLTTQSVICWFNILTTVPLIMYIKRPKKHTRSSTLYLGYSAVLSVLLTIIVIEHIPKVHISVQIVDNLCTYYRLCISNFGDLSNSETGRSFLLVNRHFRCVVSMLGGSIIFSIAQVCQKTILS